LPLLPIFRQVRQFPQSSVISGTFSRENCSLPKRPKIAKHTKLLPRTFQDFAENAEDMGRLRNVQGALSKLERARRFEELHLELYQKGRLEDSPNADQAAVDEGVIARKESRAMAANLLLCAGDGSMNWLDHSYWSYGSSALDPWEFRAAIRFVTYDIAPAVVARRTKGTTRFSMSCKRLRRMQVNWQHSWEVNRAR
jgi:hypothetical protein